MHRIRYGCAIWFVYIFIPSFNGLLLDTTPPPNCDGANEEFRICGPYCPMTCDNIDTNVCCNLTCVEGCFCKDGYIRKSADEPQECISIQECPTAGVLEFKETSISVPEASGVIKIYVVRLEGTKGEITVRWRAKDGTAIHGVDYEGNGGMLTMADGQDEGFVEVRIINDKLKESNNTFTLELFDATNKARIGTRNYISITIIDDDAKPGYLQFLSGVTRVDEDAGDVTLPVVRRQGKDGTVTVSWRTVDSTANAGRDYGQVVGELVFQDGEVSKTIKIDIVDDKISEPDENFVVEILDPTNGAKLGAIPKISVSIIDDDTRPGYFEFDSDSVQVKEGKRLIALTVKRTGGTDKMVTVSWRTVDITAEAGSDYEKSNGDIVLMHGEESSTITIPIIDDNIRESEEEFAVELYDPTGGAKLGRITRVTVTIIDDDEKPGVIECERAVTTVNEGNGSVSVAVIRKNGKDGMVGIHYATQDGTALAGLDYTPVSSQLSFKEGQTRRTVFIKITDDPLTEGSEDFHLVLSDPYGGATLGSLYRCTVTILASDQKPGTLEFQETEITVTEDMSEVKLTVVRTRGSDGTVTVHYTAVDGTALRNLDYTLLSGELTFPDGVTDREITVIIVDDDLKERNEYFTVRLSEPTGGATIGRKREATITILANDVKPGVLEFKITEITAEESRTEIRLTVIRTQGSDDTVTVHYRAIDGSARNSFDFRLQPGELTFPDGVTEQEISVLILDDNDREGNEDFTVQLFEPTGGATIGRNNEATVTILANDMRPGTLEFKITMMTVTEYSHEVTLTVIRNKGSDGTVKLRYRAVDGTARNNLDYILQSGELIFPDKVTEREITITILDDNIREVDEHFTVRLFDPSGGADIGMKREATITIRANDFKWGILQFEKNTTYVNEREPIVSLAVVRLHGDDGDASVKYRTKDKTATGEQDYETVERGELFFGHGVTKQIIEIPILDDNEDEPDESFIVELFDPQGGAKLGAITQSTVIIVDNDEKPSVIQFKRRRGLVVENRKTIVLLVIRQVSLHLRVTVFWKTIERSAKAGADFVEGHGNITFNPGEKEQKITINIIDDNIEEANEFFDIILYGASEHATLGVFTRYTIQIADDDKGTDKFSFQKITQHVSESDQKVVLTVQRSSTRFPFAYVRWRTVDGTAIGGVHFVTDSGKLEFSDGVDHMNITIHIINNVKENPSVHFAVELFSSSPGTTIDNGKVTIIIHDDDVVKSSGIRVETEDTTTTTPAPPPEPQTAVVTHPFSTSKTQTNQIFFQNTDIRVKEGHGIIELVILRTVANVQATVLWKVVDGSAIYGTHYRAKNILNSLTFLIGDLQLVIRIEILDDHQKNAPRTFTVVLFSIFRDSELVTNRNVAKITIDDDDDDAVDHNVQVDHSGSTGRQSPPFSHPSLHQPVIHQPIFESACPPGLILKECEKSCPATCDDWMVHTSCGTGTQGTFSCYRGCFCPDGRILEKKGGTRCIRPTECACPHGMQRVACMDTTCRPSCEITLCARQHRPITGIFGGGPTCTSGCECLPGLVLERRGSTKCIPPENCSH